MARDNFCRETIFAAQLPRDSPHHGGNFERGKLGGILRDNLGESTVIFEIITFLIQKHFKTVTVTVILRKLIPMTF